MRSGWRTRGRGRMKSGSEEKKAPRKVPPMYWHLDNKKRKPVPKWKAQLAQYNRRNKGGKA